jgi:hypothetical protein
MKLEEIKYDKNCIPTNILGRGLYSMQENEKYMGKVTKITKTGDAILNEGPERIKNEGLIRSFRGENFFRVGPVIEKEKTE